MSRDSFLSRWSRLKSEQKAEAPQPPAPAPEPAAPAEREEASPAPDLPPVEELTKDSDFSAFLQGNVPGELRQAALNKLWASDPMFTAPEVFDLHMEDYNLHPLGEAVKTAWRVGQGIVNDLTQTGGSVNFTDTSENSHNNTDKEQESTSGS